MGDTREFLEGLVYQSTDGRRFTQQSPVMPDVWIQFGLNPGAQLELLMEPNWHHTPAELAASIRERLRLDENESVWREFRDERDERSPRVACNQNVVVVTLWFDQLVRCVLPLSRWWKNSIAMLRKPESPDALHRELTGKRFVGTLAKSLKEQRHPRIAPDVIWFARVAGLIAHASRAMDASQGGAVGPDIATLETWLEDHRALATTLSKVLSGLEATEYEDPNPLYSVNLNRRTLASVHDSCGAVKADAAQRLFATEGRGVCWAVVDSGIDARHIAFRKRDENGVPYEKPFEKPRSRRRLRGRAPAPANRTRIAATYDFVHVRDLLSAEPDDVDGLNRNHFPVLRKNAMREELKSILAAKEGYAVDWERLEPFLRVPHSPGTGAQAYRPPETRHGTHVAGIIGAHWLPEDNPAPSQGRPLVGIAPAIELYDLRVLGPDGGDEFAIMSALQFIRDLNSRRDFMAIHGANLSFSIGHDVANYACGRTPVCEEAERLVSTGIVVVAAAGNSGRARYLTPTGAPDDGFRTVSITDPGNAAEVITVGSTHRSDAHTYGVSYFSSRGPTGDGRQKPDLVAPGEKVRSTVPDNSDTPLDGTSMAAPHVSGAAALLMERHREFLGQPARIKEILCQSATDLGRERYFQGAGLLDILRALQSI